jgi:hypothetical protein
MHINIKPPEKFMIYETPEQAINHVFMFGVYSKNWKSDQSFGQTIAERRAIDSAIKNRDFDAFQAFKRRGYWHIELRGKQ